MNTASLSKGIKPDGFRKKKTTFKEFRRNKALLLMLVPGLIVLLFNNYMPMLGVVMAFEKINFRKSVFLGDWAGFSNFNFFFKSTYAGIITRNTLLYNLAFILLGTMIQLFFAIALNELRNRMAGKFYQTVMFLPHFMSWIVITYVVVALFSNNYGFINKDILNPLNIHSVDWYAEPRYWPYMLIIINVWKGAGYGSVMYLASIVNIDLTYYEAARIDGASKWQQITKITVPLLKPIIIILTLLSIGRIFNTDFGLFYTVTLNSGALYDVTSTIDTYVYRTLTSGAGVNINMAAAAGLFQSVVGFCCVMLTNWMVRKVDQDYALF